VREVVGGWTAPRPEWLSDPEPRPTVKLTANVKRIDKGQSTTLSWTSSAATSLSIDQGIGPVALPSGSRVVTPLSSLTYTITAAALGGIVTDTQHITVDQPPPPPPPPPTGISSIPYFNCTDEMLHFWLKDLTAGTAWTDAGSLPSQKDEFGGCHASGAPLLVHLPAVHAYRIVAVMPSRCDDPDNPDCVRWRNEVIGDPAGVQLPSIDVG